MKLGAVTQDNVRQQGASAPRVAQGRAKGKAWASPILILLTGAAILCLSGDCPAAASVQDAAAAASASPSVPTPSLMVQPAVGELRQALGSLRLQKWKAPGAVKEDVGQNIGKIQQDLDSTLPPLLAQADGATGSVANAFAVYRNLDALYEVLLRVSGTAELAASDAEATALTHALAALGASRRMLADSILNTSHAQEAQLRQPRPAPPPAVAPPPPATTVINDGPSSSPAHKKSKPRPKPAATPQT